MDLKERKQRFFEELKSAIILAGGSDKLADRIEKEEIGKVYELLYPNGIRICFQLSEFKKRMYQGGTK